MPVWLILCILYAVGLVGVGWPLHPDFLLLTPLNLLTCLALVLYKHPPHLRRGLGWALAICYLGGFSLEWLGIQTGVVFGEYSYGSVLGPKFMGTPFMIGVNWAMLIYCILPLHNRWLGAGRPWLKAFFTALTMVAMDSLIEPVAIQHDFWTWQSPGINAYLVAPWQNYAMWFFGGLILSRIFVYFQDWYANPEAELFFGLQVIFFAFIYFFV